MVHNDIEDMLDHLRNIKSRGDLNVVKIETLEMELRFLRTFIKYPHALLPDSLVEIRKKAKLIAEMLHSVFGGIPGEYKTSLNVERLVSELQEFSKDNSNNLIYNFQLNDSYMLEYMDYLDQNLNDAPRLNEVLEKFVVLVGDILCVIQMQLLSGSTIKDDASKIDLGTIQILEKIEDLKAQVEVRDVAKVQHEHEILKDLQRRTINLAYEVEVAIDSILAQCNALWYLFCSLPAIVKEIKNIREKVTEMRFKNLLPLKPCSVIEPSKHLPIQHSNLRNDEEIVGFENDTKSILRLLIRGTNELDVIPIVGMGGQGKITCARKLYNNDIIVYHFDVRAWCVISQTYSRRELLKRFSIKLPVPRTR
ncbi:putative late blight resistance protein -like r1b-17 [Nicotiana attenuata]|uniref:Late blight resistance protein -like r1b-17 n=1 Tax=Nicotiana attenuata TaxID=49451 RepID=A0A1J6ISP1_NICAT|nr:putative late blight resistance protein -like r1b-17 [Nicotiana attenuata]